MELTLNIQIIFFFHPLIMGCTTLKDSKKKNDSLYNHRNSYSGLISVIWAKVTDHYTLNCLLGQGAFGSVYESTSNTTGVVRAIKSIKIQNFTSKSIQKILNEVNILKSLDHPGILQIFEVYRDEKTLNIVTELCSGGNLFNKIQLRGYISENYSAKIMYDIITTVKFCHDAGIVHRDLKPENIIFEDDSLDARIKIIDFGTSIKVRYLEKLNSFAGTAYYVAPEVINGEYNEMCDVWSIGVILYVMLCGRPPFAGKSLDEILRKIENEEVRYEGSIWMKISEACKSFLKKILVKNPKHRIGLEEMLLDPWIKNNFKGSGPENKLAKRAFRRLLKFKCTNKLQMSILSFFTHQSITNEKIKELRKLFEQIDTNLDGQLSKQEIKEAMTKYGSSIGLDVDEVFQQCDFDQNGFIEFSEFLTAVHSCELEFSKENLKKAFSLLDKDGNGKLSKKEIKEALIEIDEESIEQIFQQIDKNGSGEIDDEEFFEAFFSLPEFNSKI